MKRLKRLLCGFIIIGMLTSVMCTTEIASYAGGRTCPYSVTNSDGTPAQQWCGSGTVREGYDWNNSDQLQIFSSDLVISPTEGNSTQAGRIILGHKDISNSVKVSLNGINMDLENGENSLGISITEGTKYTIELIGKNEISNVTYGFNSFKPVKFTGTGYLEIHAATRAIYKPENVSAARILVSTEVNATEDDCIEADATTDWTTIKTVFIYGIIESDPAPSDPSSHTHNFEWQVITEPTMGADGLEAEVCTICGERRNEQPLSAYGYALKQYGEPLINAAQAGQTVTFEFGEWNSFPKSFMEKIAAKNDVTYVFKFKYNHQRYTICIPAGIKVDYSEDWYGPLKLAELFGAIIE